MEVVLPLDDAAADLASVGGEGASLARMAAAGLPVPAGFHITTEAYRRFVSGFRDGIDPADPAATQALFARQDVPAAVAEEIRRAYRALGEPGARHRRNERLEEYGVHELPVDDLLEREQKRPAAAPARAGTRTPRPRAVERGHPAPGGERRHRIAEQQPVDQEQVDQRCEEREHDLEQAC